MTNLATGRLNFVCNGSLYIDYGIVLASAQKAVLTLIQFSVFSFFPGRFSQD